MQYNPILFSDTYKAMGHYRMLLDNLLSFESYYESRLGAFHPYTTMASMQYYVKHFLLENPATHDHLEEAMDCAEHHVFNRNAPNVSGWKDIIDNHGGYAQFDIYAAPEGGNYPVNNVLYKFISKDGYAWQNGHFETLFMNMWGSMLSATLANRIYELALPYWDKSCDDFSSLRYSLHDFGARSVPCPYAQGPLGMGPLISYMGTDTLAAVKLIADYYQGGDYRDIAHSVTASEHSIVLQTGEGGEFMDYLVRLIKDNPHGILSLVADTYGIERFVNVYVRDCKELILSRWKKGLAPINKVVIRPDSPRFEDDTPEDQILWLVQTLDDIFGSHTNKKGYKVLHPCIGGIYGDGIKFVDFPRIYQMLLDNGYATENIILGQGGGLLNSGNRDTQRAAFKPSFGTFLVNGERVGMDMCKNPSDTSKGSKSGQLKLVKGIEWETINQHQPYYESSPCQLNHIYSPGKLEKEVTWAEVRANNPIVKW